VPAARFFVACSYATVTNKLYRMPDSYAIKDQQAAYFFTFQIVSWLDLFTRKSYRNIVVDIYITILLKTDWQKM